MIGEKAVLLEGCTPPDNLSLGRHRTLHRLVGCRLRYGAETHEAIMPTPLELNFKGEKMGKKNPKNPL